MVDTWNGAVLPERSPVATPTIHYRIYDQGGRLLSFNSTNSLDAIAADVLQTQREHPNARLRIQQVDGPAY
jgi:hypothetical protein